MRKLQLMLKERWSGRVDLHPLQAKKPGSEGLSFIAVISAEPETVPGSLTESVGEGGAV